MNVCVTIEEAGERLALSPQSIRRLIAEGRLIGYKFRRSLRVSLESLEAYIRSCEIGK